MTATATAPTTTQTYTLREERHGRWTIHRADGSWVFTIKPDDRSLAERTLANLNGEAHGASSACSPCPKHDAGGYYLRSVSSIVLPVEDVA